MERIKLNDLKPGDTIVADGGFTCLRAGEHKVWEKHGQLVVVCDDGDHFLDGQEDDDGYLVGLSKGSCDRPVY
jgi:hypothetical protein